MKTRILACVLTWLMGQTCSRADLILFSGEITVDATFFGAMPEFQIGDRFDFSFTINDAITDSNPAAALGLFPGAVTGVTLTRNPANVGTWDPGGAGFGGTTLRSLDWTSDSFDMNSASFVGVPSIASGSLTNFFVYFGDPSATHVTDGGIGQDFNTQVDLGGDLATSFPDGSASLSFDGSGAIVRFVMGGRGFSAVPEPGTTSLLFCGVALCAILRRRFTAPD